MANLERHGRAGRGEGWSRNGGESGGVSDKIKFVAYTMRSVPASLRTSRCACLLLSFVYFLCPRRARATRLLAKKIDTSVDQIRSDDHEEERDQKDRVASHIHLSLSLF